ncbi:MAG: tetratricopeptide repeat protein [Candidatus Hodarchaeota archaeon]
MVRQEDAGGSTDPAQQEPIQHAEHLFWHGKFPEALEHLDQLETQEDLSELAQLQSQLLKCRILAQLDIKKAQDVATQILQTSQDLDQSLIRIDALLIMAEAWLELGKLDISKDLVEQGKDVLTTIPSLTASDLTAREATVLALEGGIYTFTGPMERAVECIQQSLMLREQLGAPQAIAQSFMYLGIVFLCKTELEHAIDFFQQSLTIRERLQHPQEIAYTLIYLGWVYCIQGERERAQECFQKSLTICKQLGYQHGIAWNLHWISLTQILQGELESALELLRTCLAICEQLGIPETIAESGALQQLGHIYSIKGELGTALEYFQKSLALEEARGWKQEVGWCLSRIGEINWQKGQLEDALECLTKSLQVQEEIGTDSYISMGLVDLVRISLELGNLESARHYLYRLEILRDKVASKFVDLKYDFSRALLLKASPRTRDKMQAQMLFQQIAEDDVLYVGYTVPACLHLCELLFFEFKTSEDPDILHEIQTITNRLLGIARAQKSHSLLAETYLLQAKLVLLDLDVPRARYLLTEAQTIAEEKGLQLLAQSISHEHNTLLRQLNQWEALQARKAPPVEASELAGVETQVVRMIHKHLNEFSDNLLKGITNSFQILKAPISKKTHPLSMEDRIFRKYPNLKYDDISTVIISCLERKERLNISQLTEEVRIQRGSASRRIIRERVNHLIKQGIIEELDEGYGRQLRVIPLSDS